MNVRFTVCDFCLKQLEPDDGYGIRGRADVLGREIVSCKAEACKAAYRDFVEAAEEHRDECARLEEPIRAWAAEQHGRVRKHANQQLAKLKFPERPRLPSELAKPFRLAR